MDKKYKVGIVGATGMVGQRFVLLLHEHPWFDLKILAASGRSSGKTYGEAVEGRWAMDEQVPESVKNIVLLDGEKDCERIAAEVDFIFCAVDMKKDEIRALEEKYAKLECPVISNNSAHRLTPDVPMIIPELNPEHAEVIPYFRKRMGIKRGLIAVKSNCSIQSFVPLVHPLLGFGVTKILACTYQAISGAGKTFDRWPEMVDNVIPYIGGEEEKTEQEPLKVWGKLENGGIALAKAPLITSQCIRVPVTNGHMAATFVSFENRPSNDEIIDIWKNFKTRPQELGLPMAPKQFIRYFDDPDRPQTKTERELEKGMAITAGRLRDDSQYDVKFIGLSHNTLRGAAGGAVELAELLCAEGYIEKN